MPTARTETAAPLSELFAEIAALYPRRTVLKVGEFARLTGVSNCQVADLIEAGELVAINIGNTHGNKSNRKAWRIPLSAVRVYLAARQNA